MKTRNFCIVATVLVIAFVLGTGFESSTDEKDTEEIESITAATTTETAPEEIKSHGRPEFDGRINELRTEKQTTEEPKLEVVPAVEIVTSEDTEEARPNMTFHSYAGTYELTAYIATGNPCADGVYPQTGHTAACNDPALWHRWIEIEGYGTFYVHDTGGMASNVIDIFMGSYDEAIQFGRRTGEVYIIE